MIPPLIDAQHVGWLTFSPPHGVKECTRFESSKFDKTRLIAGGALIDEEILWLNPSVNDATFM